MSKKKKEFKHNREHCWGRQVAVYVNRYKKWLKIGLYCNCCGAIQVDYKFEKGLPRE